MALLRQFSGDDVVAYYDEKTGQYVTGPSNRNPSVTAHPEHGANDFSNDSSQMYKLLQSLISMSNEQTEAQNALQLKMMREANAVTVAEGQRQRDFNAEQSLEAFQRSEQSRLATQEYNTGERLAAQEYNTGERLAAQEYNTSERLASQDWQEYMSGSQYQRAVKDLYAAGLNPLLAVGAQASYGNVSPGRSSGASVSPGRSSASQGYAASSSAGHGTSASAYRSNVESLINGVLSYMTAEEQHDVQRDSSILGFLGKIFSSLISDFSYSKGSYKHYK